MRQKPASKLSSLRQIPGVGVNFVHKFAQLGIYEIEDLQDQKPEELYRRYEELSGQHVDRCVLYVFRLAVYFAEHESPAEDKLRWWNWKD